MDVYIMLPCFKVKKRFFGFAMLSFYPSHVWKCILLTRGPVECAEYRFLRNTHVAKFFQLNLFPLLLSTKAFLLIPANVFNAQTEIICECMIFLYSTYWQRVLIFCSLDVWSPSHKIFFLFWAADEMWSLLPMKLGVRWWANSTKIGRSRKYAAAWRGTVGWVYGTVGGLSTVGESALWRICTGWESGWPQGVSGPWEIPAP